MGHWSHGSTNLCLHTILDHPHARSTARAPVHNDFPQKVLLLYDTLEKGYDKLGSVQQILWLHRLKLQVRRDVAATNNLEKLQG
jgi:hypothetical protein